jgi:predicted enzyme related to lactoylglutathione lyase
MAEVLWFHHAQGLTPGIISFADTVTRAGHIVHTPDLFEGRTFDRDANSVGDLAESLRRIQEEGGKVVKAMQGKDGAYVYAAVQDPVGAHLALMPG